MKFLSRAVKQSIVVLVFLVSTLPCMAGSNAATPSLAPAVKPLHVYKALIPLGSEVFAYTFEREHATFYIMASASNREFEGQELYAVGDHHELKMANGDPVKRYPRQVHFRISVSERAGYAPREQPFLIETHDRSFTEYITSLKFEMKIFHALKARILRPTKITHIGVPPDVPSNERIYDVAFDLGEVPITDRIVMHVLTPRGDRLAKFNVDLY